MALSQGTNYSYTPPKPKPANTGSYGAPSGPYAGPSGPLSYSNGVPTYRDPNDLYQARGGVNATPENNIANNYMSGVMGGVLGMFRPSTYTSMPANLKYAAQHPGEAAHQMFGTAEGWGNLTAGALTLAAPGPKGLNLLKSGAAVEKPVSAIPRGVQWAPGAEAKIAEHFGEAPTAATRASMLSQAPSLASVLAEKAAMRKQIQNMVGPQSYNSRFQRGINAEHSVWSGGSVDTPTGLTHDPMAGRYFKYTGHDKAINPDQHMQEVIDNYGHGSDEFANAYDDYLDEPNYDTGGGDMGHWIDDHPPTVHNLHDQRGNVMGSLSYAETKAQPGVFGGGRHSGLSQEGMIHDPEVYMRPEYRSATNFRRLIQPLLDKGKYTPIDVTLANDKLVNPLLKYADRGDIRITDRTRQRALQRDPDYPGTPNAEGKYPYEVPSNQLPGLMGPLKAKYYPKSMERLNPSRKGSSRTKLPEPTMGGFYDDMGGGLMRWLMHPEYRSTYSRNTGGF